MVYEIWLPVPGYEDNYEVSNKGNVRSIPRIVSWKNKHGAISKTKYPSRELVKMKMRSRRTTYRVVALSLFGVVKKFLVSRLVLAAFKGLDLSRSDLFACHIDDNGENNVVENLFIGTAYDNVHDAIHKGRLDNSGEKNGMSKLKQKDVIRIRNLLSAGFSGREIAKRFGISDVTVSNIKTGCRW